MHNKVKGILIGKCKWDRSYSKQLEDSTGILFPMINTQVAHSRKQVRVCGIARCIGESIYPKEGKDYYCCFVHFIINIIHLAQWSLTPCPSSPKNEHLLFDPLLLPSLNQELKLSSIYKYIWFNLKPNQMRLQNPEDSCFFFIIGFSFFCKTIRIASSKIAFSPSCVNALHSMYLHWNYSSIIFRALYFKMGCSFGSFFIIWYSSLKSILFPTNILATFPTFSVNSGYHYMLNGLPSYARWQKMRVRLQKTLLERHRSWDKQVVWVDYTLLGLQYPIVQGSPSSHQLSPSQHNYQTLWGHIKLEICLAYS